MKTIVLRAKKAVFNSQIGLFSSKAQGEGYDFFDLEPYDFTSDARRIDWKAYARTRELYSKVFNKEVRKNILLLPILTGSLFFGSSRLKFETLLESLSIVAYSALRYKENLTIGTHRIQNHYELDRLLQQISQTDLIGLRPSLEYHRSNQKHLTILIGDFLDELDLDFLAARDDVVALVVRDHLETSRTIKESASLVDTMSLAKTSADLSSSMPHYHKKIARTLAKRYDYFTKLGIEWIELFENDDIFTRLALFFRSR